ncbi:hypothetical protein H4R24_004267 [Coemansia sp. RSA 988]|nr:hypothetical protein H4R24_004267 [Coemansia sp. RSA 988]
MSDSRTIEKQSTRKHNLGLRRAKTATANSIKKLFKSRRDASKSRSDDGTIQQEAITEKDIARMAGLASNSVDSSSVPFNDAAHLQHRAIESRPSSSHSTRSVRSIFSSAKRITLRSSMLFRHQNHVAAIANGSSLMLDECPATSRSPSFVVSKSDVSAAVADSALVSSSDQTSPSQTTADAQPSLCPSPKHTGRHAFSAYAQHTALVENEDGAETTRRYSHSGGLMGLKQRHSSARLSQQVQQPLSIIRHPPMPTQALPSVPHTPPASYSSDNPRSPTAYSSKSLGLSMLDFGYSEQIADGIMPSSPVESSCSSSVADLSLPSASSSHSSQMSGLYLRISPTQMPPAMTENHLVNHIPKEPSSNTGNSYKRQYMEISMKQDHDCDQEEIHDEELVPLIETHIADMVNIGILGEMDRADNDKLSYKPCPATEESGVAVDTDTEFSFSRHQLCLDFGALNLSEGVIQEPASGDKQESTELAPMSNDLIGNIVAKLGSVAIICQHALEAIAYTESSITGVENIMSLVPSPPQSITRLSYVVNDIDELLAELGIADSLVYNCNTIGDTHASETSGLESSLSQVDDGDSFSLRDIDELLEQLDEAAGYTKVQAKAIPTVLPSWSNERSQPDPPVLDIVYIIQSLGNVCAVVSAGELHLPNMSSLIPPMQQLDNVQNAITRLPAPKNEQMLVVDIDGLLSDLGAPERIVGASISLPFLVCGPILDVASLISNLGRILSSEVVSQITSTMDIVPQRRVSEIPPNTTQLVTQLGRCPLMMGPSYPASEQIEECTRKQTKLTQPTLDVPDIIASLGGVYTPDFILCNIKRMRKASTQTLVDDLDDDIAASMETHHFSYVKFSHMPLIPHKSCDNASQSANLGLLGSDVDEVIADDSRSRTSSISSFNQQFENFQSISKLMAALNIQPIVVSRPFLSPSRNVLFSQLY